MTASDPVPESTGIDRPGEDAIRIGDRERNAAVAALGEHMSTGRLDLDEFGTRSAKAGSARTVGELTRLFADLPVPHPPLPQGASPMAVPGQPIVGAVQQIGTASPALVDNRNRAQKFVAAAAGASGMVALVLFFLFDYDWRWFLLVPLISSIAGGIWGDSWKSPDSRRERH